MSKLIKKLSAYISSSVPVILMALMAHMAIASPTKDDSLRFEILLNSKMLTEIRFNEKFIPSLDITTDRLLLLSTSDQFYELGWGGIVPLGKKVPGNINSFAFTAEKLLLTIRNNEVCRFDSLGNLVKLFKLPGIGMGISAGTNVMYVYDRTGGKTNYALYVIAKGGKYSKVLDVPSPIRSVVEMNNSILFATENGLFSYNLKSKALKALAAVPKDEEIKSIALDTLSNRIYFSTDSMVYAVKDLKPVLITDKIGGVLRFFNNGLIVFNPDQQLLIRMAGIENVMAKNSLAIKTDPMSKPANETLTNESIINLVKAELSDDLIIKIINKSEVAFNVNVDSMIVLSNQHVSSAVITAMKNAMKRKNSDELKGSD